MRVSKNLLEQTAEDLMSRDLLVIPRHMSVKAAAQQLSSAGVTGAPVVDSNGRCVGVLSAMDVLRFLDQGPHAEQKCSSACFCSDWGLELDSTPVDDVERYMTTDVITASPETPIGTLARTMLDAHIHRVIVVDSQERPIGIVSSTDILAAVAAEDAQRASLSGV